ncbi:MAG: hypothetical protein K2I64_01395 [Muribaculaceae bacterium]|nr:hypothetical protein [Muribaculaceae bacterium]
MNKSKTITLTIDEFSQIIEISDPVLRQAILTAVQNAAAAPESIDLSAYTDAHPLIQSLVKKLKTRAEAARKRAEKRKATPAKQPKKKQTTAANTTAVYMPLNDNNVRRLLWIKQHYAETIDNIMRILTAQNGNTLGQHLSSCFSEVASAVQAYLRPLIDVASNYFRTPKHRRPLTVRIPMPSGL